MAGPAPTNPPNVLRDLHLAVCYGDVDTARRLCTRENADFVDAEHGLCLLAWAIAGDHLEVAALLLDRGASTKLRDRAGFCPLHRAVWEGSVGAVKLLLGAGADVNARSVRHAKTPLILAALKGSTEKVEALLAHGAAIDARGTDGMGAIDHATYKGFAPVVERLIDAGADCHAARYYCEEGVKHVETVPQRENFDRIIELMCRPWVKQSLASV